MASKPLEVSLSGHEDAIQAVLTLPTTRLRKTFLEKLEALGAKRRGSSATYDVPTHKYDRVAALIRSEYPDWKFSMDDSAVIRKASPSDRIAWGVLREGWGQGDRVGYLPVGVLRRKWIFKISTSYISRNTANARLYSSLPGLIGDPSLHESYLGFDSVAQAQLQAEELLVAWAWDFQDALGGNTEVRP